MNEKKALVADVLHIPLNDYDSIAEVCLSAFKLLIISLHLFCGIS